MAAYGEEVVKKWERGELTFNETLEECGMSKSTFYRRLRVFRDSD